MRYLINNFTKLALLAIMAMLPQLASAHEFYVDGIYYNIKNGNEATVTYRGSSYDAYSNEYTGAVNIPSSVTYNGTTYSVTTIGGYAFNGCTGLTSVTIPNSVTTIGGNAFNETAWYNNQPDGLVYAGMVAYKYKGTMPNGISIVLKAGCVGIASYAFEGCTGLTSVTIPNSVTTIGGSAFYDCTGLTSMVVESGNTKYDSRNNCNAIIETATNTLISGCKNTIIPGSVTTIGYGAFYGCSGLISVTIPNSVTTIGSYAFSCCSGLTSVTIPNSVTSIGQSTFSYCTGLTSVTIPNSVTAIGFDAFVGCSGLTSVTIPNSVTSIGRSTFSYCTGLTSVTIPNSVTSIGEAAFYGCTDLTSLTLTGNGSWYYNSSRHKGLASIRSQLKTINIGKDITYIGKDITYSGNFGFTADVVNSYAETPPSCSSGTFSNYDGALHVPQASMASYFMADYWQNFNNMVNDLGKVTLDKASADISLWDSLSLTATVTPAGEEVIWSTTNPWVAAVDENGVVTATGGGECDIYATLASSHDAEYAICHITVIHTDVTLSLSDESLEMILSEEQTLTVTITPDNTGLTPTWSSSNTSVATVDENGKVVAVGEGECDITAKVLDQTATCHVTVTNNVIITLNLDNSIIGANQALTVYPTCSPDVPVELVVTSSDPSVAVARVINRTNAPAAPLMTFTAQDIAMAWMENLATPSGSKAPAMASEKAIMIVGVQNGTATITVTTADGKATPAVLELRVVDVDGDRVITTADVTSLYNYLLGGDETYTATSDTDGDGNITAADITVLYNLLLGN